MSTQRDEREALFDSLFEIASNYNINLTNNPDMHREVPSIGDFCGDVERAVLEAGYRKPKQVTTVEELDALPVGSVVIDGDGDICERMSSGWFGIIKEAGADPWLLAGAEEAPLPATVLHTPEAAE